MTGRDYAGVIGPKRLRFVQMDFGFSIVAALQHQVNELQVRVKVILVGRTARFHRADQGLFPAQRLEPQAGACGLVRLPRLFIQVGKLKKHLTLVRKRLRGLLQVSEGLPRVPLPFVDPAELKVRESGEAFLVQLPEKVRFCSRQARR